MARLILTRQGRVLPTPGELVGAPELGLGYRGPSGSLSDFLSPVIFSLLYILGFVFFKSCWVQLRVCTFDFESVTGGEKTSWRFEQEEPISFFSRFFRGAMSSCHVMPCHHAMPSTNLRNMGVKSKLTLFPTYLDLSSASNIIIEDVMKHWKKRNKKKRRSPNSLRLLDAPPLSHEVGYFEKDFGMNYEALPWMRSLPTPLGRPSILLLFF